MWPSAVALSEWLVSHTELVQDKTALEIGAGCGLVGLVAARIQRESTKASGNETDKSIGVEDGTHGRTIITDFNPTVLENARQNVKLNSVIAEVTKLDFYEQTGKNEQGWLDGDGAVRPQVDIVLAADVICQPSDARAAAKTIRDVLKPGGVALVVCADAKHRFGVDHFENECILMNLAVNVCDYAKESGSLHNSDNFRQTSGFVDGMTLTMFTIHKH